MAAVQMVPILGQRASRPIKKASAEKLLQFLLLSTRGRCGTRTEQLLLASHSYDRKEKEPAFFRAPVRPGISSGQQVCPLAVLALPSSSLPADPPQFQSHCLCLAAQPSSHVTIRVPPSGGLLPQQSSYSSQWLGNPQPGSFFSSEWRVQLPVAAETYWLLLPAVLIGWERRTAATERCGGAVPVDGQCQPNVSQPASGLP
ncbi:hypothetical protein UY3_09553 [Chelonia mydas]|uniref:Uncharacterized protein n=1 Tax=Chelonia mydas TaxID=8469 RepID=M7BMV3_CHEMY|nr:hypothetical protein UY3_09553 [Chelonia mydas]